MRIHVTNYRDNNPTSRHLLHRAWWVRDVPRAVLPCRLLGHKPVVDGTEDSGSRPGFRWVTCGRCGIRPEPQGSLDPARWQIGQSYTRRLAFGVASTEERKPLAGQRDGMHVLQWPGAWPARPAGDVGAELVLGRGASTGICLKVGNASSEQVLAADFGVAGLFHLYVHTERHGQWLQRRLNPRGYESRVTSIAVHDRRVWTQMWARRNEWSSTDPWWMHGTFRLDPRDVLLGERRYTYESIGERRDGTVRMPEGDDHQVTLQLQKQNYGRCRGRVRTKWTVEWSSRAGVPVRNHEWKGDEVFGSSVDVPYEAVESGRWPAVACAEIAAQCSRDRARYRYTPTITT